MIWFAFGIFMPFVSDPIEGHVSAWTALSVWDATSELIGKAKATEGRMRTNERIFTVYQTMEYWSTIQKLLG